MDPGLGLSPTDERLSQRAGALRAQLECYRVAGGLSTRVRRSTGVLGSSPIRYTK